MSAFTFVSFMYLVRAAFHALLREGRALRHERREDHSQPNRRRKTKLRTINRPGRRWLAVFDDLAVVKPVYLWLVALFILDFLLFALAITLIEPVIATVIFEFWPVIFGLLTLTPIWYRKLLRSGQAAKPARERRAQSEESDSNSLDKSTLPRMMIMLVVGGIGVSLAVLSDVDTLDWSATDSLGILLAVMSTLFTALAIATIQILGKDQRDPLDSEHTVASAATGARHRLEGGGPAAQRNQTDVSVAGNVAAGVLVAPLFAATGVVVSLFDSSDLWVADGLMFAAVAGATQIAASWCFTHANHLYRDAHSEAAAQINTFHYLAPVGALILLAWLADTTIKRPDLLIVGAAAVVVVNMVLHLDPEGAQQRVGGGGQGYQAFVLALWSVAAVVLFRDDWLPGGWHVWSVVEYWGIVGVCATVFTLILSFRQSRLAERRRDMDALMLRLHQQIVFMGSCGDLEPTRAEKAGSLLRDVDEIHDPKSLGNAYFELRKLLIAEMNPESDRDHAKRLSESVG